MQTLLKGRAEKKKRIIQCILTTEEDTKIPVYSQTIQHTFVPANREINQVITSPWGQFGLFYKPGGPLVYAKKRRFYLSVLAPKKGTLAYV